MCTSTSSCRRGWTTATPNSCASSRRIAPAMSPKCARRTATRPAGCSVDCAKPSPAADRSVPGLFYVDSLTDVGTVMTVSGEEGFHAATVRRIRPGEELTLSDGAGGMAGCVVKEAGRDGLRALVLSRWFVAP